MESILNSTKKLIGMDPEYKRFDTDVIIHINSVFMILEQLGVGPEGGFKITSDIETWDKFLNNDTAVEDEEMYVYKETPASAAYLEAVKTYMGLKVGLIFDPPTSSALLEAKKQLIGELETRLCMQAELLNKEV